MDALDQLGEGLLHGGGGGDQAGRSLAIPMVLSRAEYPPASAIRINRADIGNRGCVGIAHLRDAAPRVPRPRSRYRPHAMPTHARTAVGVAEARARSRRFAKVRM
jgi:hypothetical protein